MNEQNTEHFFEAYPEMFPKGKPMLESLLCFGLMCGDGWFDLIDSLCRYMYEMCKNNQWKIPEVVEVKEKYGTLRFYTYIKDAGSDETFEGAIRFAEYLSGTICEYCGGRGATRYDLIWCRTLCDSCLAKATSEKEQA